MRSKCILLHRSLLLKVPTARTSYNQVEHAYLPQHLSASQSFHTYVQDRIAKIRRGLRRSLITLVCPGRSARDATDRGSAGHCLFSAQHLRSQSFHAGFPAPPPQQGLLIGDVAAF